MAKRITLLGYPVMPKVSEKKQLRTPEGSSRFRSFNTT